MSIIPNAISSKVGMAFLHLQKTSPNLLFAGGIAGVVGAAVLASRATLKLDEVLEESKDVLAKIETIEHDDYTDEDRVKDKALIYFRAAVQVGKLYLPAIGVGALAIAALSGSHVILTRRNFALTAAYATVEKAYREYRDRVVKDLGEDKDREYLYGGETDKVVSVNAEGKKKTKDVKVGTGLSGYGKLYNEHNANWTHIPEHNYMFLRGVQSQLNNTLRAKGYLMLCDAYDALGFERTPASQVVGWLTDGDGDGYVDFGIFNDASALRIHDYVTGREGELYLDFNVDGIMYDKIG